MRCPVCGNHMTEYEKKTFDDRCADCYSDVWAAKNIANKGDKQQVENVIKIFKEMRRKEHDELIKNSYNCAINSYKRQLKEMKRGEANENTNENNRVGREHPKR